jgi:ABC-type glutathione transport system ATPase component
MTEEHQTGLLLGTKTKKQLENEEKLMKKRTRAAAKREAGLKATAEARKRRGELSELGFDACVVTTSDGDIASNIGTTSSGEVALKLIGLEMAYDGGDGHLLRPSSLTLLRGRRYGLTGRNGVGKSTLLHHLSKLAPNDLSVRCSFLFYVSFFFLVLFFSFFLVSHELVSRFLFLFFFFRRVISP